VSVYVVSDRFSVMASADSLYRSTFPDLEANFLRGGRRMELDNLEQIARSLNRPTNFILQSLQYSLNTVGYTKNSRYFLRGKFTKRQLQTALEAFVKDYVRCQLCANPETSLHVRNHALYVACRGCGAFLLPYDQEAKLVNFAVVHLE
jgi:translation initiation factor 2 subunit 2